MNSPGATKIEGTGLRQFAGPDRLSRSARAGGGQVSARCRGRSDSAGQKVAIPGFFFWINLNHVV